jgi:hypothetical protein
MLRALRQCWSSYVGLKYLSSYAICTRSNRAGPKSQFRTATRLRFPLINSIPERGPFIAICEAGCSPTFLRQRLKRGAEGKFLILKSSITKVGRSLNLVCLRASAAISLDRSVEN